MGFFDELFPARKKSRKEIIKENQQRGKEGEELTKKKWRILHFGGELKRKPYGQDFIGEEMALNTSGKRKIYIETKTGGAKLSRLQKKRRRQVQRQGHVYHEERWGGQQRSGLPF